MELSREEIRDIGISTAQHVLEGLHRYTVDYAPPSSVQQGLRDSMIEERTANDWYHRRSKMAAQLGDKTTADLYVHIAGEEEQHWKEFGQQLAKIHGEISQVSISTAGKTLVLENKKYTLVGTESNEAKADLWAENMRRHGEKIEIVEYIDGFALYRQE